MRLARLRARNGQRGQVVPIFALMALVIVGAVALAVDYGFLTDQHRNLQTFADNAAIAGAQQLSQDGASAASGRKSAMVYIRDNLHGSFSAASGFPCASGTKDYTADVDNCVLPSPYGNYSINVHSPGKYSAGCAYQCLTISVEITDTVTNTVASVLGINTTQVGAIAEAKAQPANQPLPTALYADGCINTSSVSAPIVVDGDIYLNQCTVKPALAGGFCAVTTPTANGNIVFGPEAFLPGSILQGQNLATCQAQLAGVVSSMGRVKQVPSSMLPPSLPPPPGPVGTAASNRPCKNGTVDSTGATASNCYDPGVYTDTDLHVANNLNPGVYYVNVDSGSTCFRDTSVTSCGGVYFEDNTMNANLNGVIDKCWAPLNVPSTNTFVSPCPDGLITDPTTPHDPQCTGGPAVGATEPVAWSASNATLAVGNLGAGKAYSVRVSALSTGSGGGGGVFGESAATAETSTTSSATGSIHLSFTAGSVGETHGYNVYIGPAGQEQYAATVPHPLLPVAFTYDVTTLPVSGARHYPLFDNSQCLTGFHNIPHSKDQVVSGAFPNQNFGVTFVLSGKAGLCMGTDPGGQYCTPSAAAHTVLLDPYCASGFTPNPESQTCTNRANDDGAYAVYGGSQGAIRTSGILAAMNMSGTVFLPHGTLQEDLGSRFMLTPGQMVVHDVNLSIGTGLLNPVVYYAPSGAVLPPIVALIQ